MIKYQICVSGAAAGETVTTSHQLAFDLGKSIAEAGHTLLTGATVGLPHYAAMGAKKAGGLSIGYSPAASHREHVKAYRLPTEEFDYINYTGMSYVGRDAHLVRSSDAVITVGGRMGSLHEFSTASESHKVCGVLLGSGGLADFIPILVEKIPTPGATQIIYDTDPKRLVQRIIEALDEKFSHDDINDMPRDYTTDPPNRAG